MTIPFEKITNIQTIVVHDSCPDGIASAMLLRLYFPTAEVKFVQYNTKAHQELEAKPHTIFADFSPHRDRVEDFRRVEAIVLDHHVTQKDVVLSFGNLGVFGEGPGVSGATLVFQEVIVPHFMKDHENRLESLLRREVPPPLWSDYFNYSDVNKFAKLAGIRDTWKTDDPCWIEACRQASALMFWPVETLLNAPPANWNEKLSLGVVLFDKQLERAKLSVEKSFRFTSAKGTRVVTFAGTHTTSDAMEYLRDSVDLVVGFDLFTQDAQPSVLWSTRSNGTFDCGSFCKAYGGGGHFKAAGFRQVLRLNDPHPFTLIREVLNAYESR